jgi:excisionase family DNA binding protein
MPLLQSARQAAEYLGVGRTKLLALLKAGRIKAKVLDGRIEVTTQSLDQFAAGLSDYNALRDDRDDKLGELLLQSMKARRKGKRGDRGH